MKNCTFSYGVDGGGEGLRDRWFCKVLLLA